MEMSELFSPEGGLPYKYCIRKESCLNNFISNRICVEGI